MKNGMKKFIIVMVVLFMVVVNVPVLAANGWEFIDGRDRINLLGNTTVDENTSGDVIVIAGNVDVEADVDGDVVVVMGNLNLDAAVSGDVITLMGKVTLTDKARVMGDVVTLGSVDKADGAYIEGENSLIKFGYININSPDMNFLAMLRFVVLFFSLVLLLIFGLVVIYFTSQRFIVIEAGIEYGTGRKFVIGLLGLIASFIITILFCWTLIVPLVFLLLMLLAKVATCVYIGKMALKVSNARLNIYIEFVTGAIAIMLAEILLFMLIPQERVIQSILAGGLLNVAVNSLGIGILVDSKFGKSTI